MLRERWRQTDRQKEEKEEEEKAEKQRSSFFLKLPVIELLKYAGNKNTL